MRGGCILVVVIGQLGMNGSGFELGVTQWGRSFGLCGVGILCFRRRFAVPARTKKAHSCRLTGRLVTENRSIYIIYNRAIGLSLPGAAVGGIREKVISNVSIVRVTLPCSGGSNVTGET